MQAIERDMRGRKVKQAKVSKKNAHKRKPTGYFRIARPDTGFTAGDMSLEVRDGPTWLAIGLIR